MPQWPFFCPYMNQLDEDDEDFRSPDGFQPPGMPGQFPDFTPPFGPGGPPVSPEGGYPPGPPPSVSPQFSQGQGIGVFAVDPGAIRRCRFHYVYIRLNNGRQFWAWLTFVGRTSVAGYRWNGRRWVYFGIDLRRISDFVCL